MATLTALGATHGFTTGDLDTSGYVAAVAAFQKIYVADGRRWTNDIATTGYHIIDFINTRITSSSSPTWTRGISVSQDQGGGNIARGIFDTVIQVGSDYWVLIYRTTTLEFNDTNDIVPSTGATLTSGDITAVTAPPHWMKWDLTDPNDSSGFPDGGSNVMALCFGRIFMNNLSSPNQWFCTRKGGTVSTSGNTDAMRDILVGQDDVGSAASSQTAKAGLVGDAIVALIPYKDNYLVFGCRNQLWVLRSDPLAGGILTLVSNETGIFSPQSYCWDDKNNLYFVGSDGIYSLTAEAIISGGTPTNITKEHLPDLVKSLALNRKTDRVCMSYDKLRYGINVSVSQMDGQWSVNFWLDLRTGGFFPEAYPTGCIPSSMLYFDSRTAELRGQMFGCYDGYIRKFDEDTKHDVNESDVSVPIDSYAVIGPIVDSKDSGSDIQLSNLNVITGTDTDNLTVKLHAGATGQALIDGVLDGSSTVVSKELQGNALSSTIRQKISGGALAIEVGNPTVDESFSIERINADVVNLGGSKK